MTLLKPMSNYEQDDFEFFEEAEWRILHDEDWYEKLKRAKPILGPIANNLFCNGASLLTFQSRM